MKQKNTTRINGGVSGNGHRFTNNNFNFKSVRYETKRPPNKDEPLAAFSLAFVAMIVTAYIYLRHYEQIFFWLKAAIAICGALHISAVVGAWRSGEDDANNLIFPGVGILLLAVQSWLLLSSSDALPSSILLTANQPVASKGYIGSAFEVWGRFGAAEHRIIVESVSVAAVLMPSILLNAVLGIAHLLTTQLSDIGPQWLLERLPRLRLWSAVSSALLVVIGLVALSGWLMPQTM